MFEERLNKLLETNKMTHEQLGKAIGLSGSAVSMMATGKRKPSYESLEAICRVFKTTPSYLMGFEDEISESDKIILAAIKMAKEAENKQNPDKQKQLLSEKEDR